MREAQVIVPRYTPAGRITFPWRKAMGEELAREFGGYTKLQAFGADPTTPKGEPVFLYTVAMEPTAANAAKLMAIALRAWQGSEQLYGYVRFATGDVSIVDVQAARPELVQAA